MSEESEQADIDPDREAMKPYFEYSEYSVEGDLERLGRSALIARRGRRYSLPVRLLAIAVVVSTAMGLVLMFALLFGSAL